MPYIKNRDTMVNHADACGAGMKKSGLISSSGWTRIPSKILRSRTPQTVPPFKLTCCRPGPAQWTGGPQYRGRMGIM